MKIYEWKCIAVKDLKTYKQSKHVPDSVANIRFIPFQRNVAQNVGLIMVRSHWTAPPMFGMWQFSFWVAFYT